MNQAIVHREVSLDTDDPTFDSYGKILDGLLAFDFVTAVTLDLRTPSSASSPVFDITFRDSPQNRFIIADFFNDDLAELDFT